MTHPHPRSLGTFQDWCEDISALVCVVVLVGLVWKLIYMTAPDPHGQHPRITITTTEAQEAR